MTQLRYVAKTKGYIYNSTLVLFAYATAFLVRMVTTFGAPSVMNFTHFVTVPWACGLVLTKNRSTNRQQITTSWLIITGLFALLSVMITSALLNNAGIVNIVLSFLLLGEPFIMLLAITSLPMSAGNIVKMRSWVVRFSLFHLGLALVQRHVLRMNTWHGTGLHGGDHIQGVFWKSGAGHVVGASVSITFALYYLVTVKTAPLWLRIVVALAAFWQIIISDAKQVLLAFLVAGVILVLTKLTNLQQSFKYIIGAVIFALIFNWCLQNVPAFDAFNTWVRPSIYGPEGEATLLKTATFRIVPTYYTSPLNWLFGLGPGHTVGRLGGWMLKEYSELLEPLGSTRHLASRAVWRAVGASWLGDQSSMFSPLFGWAGLWGDLGFLGLAVYAYLAVVVWLYICVDDISKLILLSVFVFGLIFSQIEEPGYMISVAMFIGLQWQEAQQKKD